MKTSYVNWKKRSGECKAKGICTTCHVEPARLGKVTCLKCKAVKAAYEKRIREERKANGLCVHCAKEAITGRTRCQKCIDGGTMASRKYKKRDGTKAIQKRWAQKLKDQVFQRYGGYVCACCGEQRKEFLSIDHVNNDGYKHRKEIGNRNFYHWLRKNGFPDGFQVLCMNCNFAKGHFDECPHVRERRQKSECQEI